MPDWQSPSTRGALGWSNVVVDETSPSLAATVASPGAAPPSGGVSAGEPTLRDEPSSLQVGERFRSLHVHSVLGRGAMGTVYLASHEILRTPFVVKCFDAPEDPEIFREAHLAARVRSANVVGVVDAGFEGGRPFVVQRYVDGIDLRELVERRRALGVRLPLPLVCDIAVEAARGLHAIHQAGLVHCDVKPDNLFFDGRGHALVGDLGIAVDPARRAQPPTSLSGTPLYMAPERWLGAAFDHRADLYALGATLHRLATGLDYFDGPDLPSVRLAHLERAYVPPSTDVPAEAYFFAAIAQLLHKAPAARPQHAEEFARTIETIAPPLPRFVRYGDAQAHVGPLRVELVKGDLATTEADVLVSAANVQLEMKLGVAKALARAGGDAIEGEARAQGPASMGDVVWTSAGALKARWVAHAVAAMSGAVCIQRCVLRALLEADARGARSVALPALGTGVGEVPLDVAATMMLEAVATFGALAPVHLRDVRLVLLDDEALRHFRGVLRLC